MIRQEKHTSSWTPAYFNQSYCRQEYSSRMIGIASSKITDSTHRTSPELTQSTDLIKNLRHPGHLRWLHETFPTPLYRGKEHHTVVHKALAMCRLIHAVNVLMNTSSSQNETRLNTLMSDGPLFIILLSKKINYATSSLTCPVSSSSWKELGSPAAGWAG